MQDVPDGLFFRGIVTIGGVVTFFWAAEGPLGGPGAFWLTVSVHPPVTSCDHETLQAGRGQTTRVITFNHTTSGTNTLWGGSAWHVLSHKRPGTKDFDKQLAANKRAMEDLVRTLGGTTWQLYRRVLLPLSRAPMAICFFQTFLISWFQYGLTLLVGTGKIQTLPIRVYAYVNEADPGYAAVASALLMLPPVLLLWSNRRLAPGAHGGH